MENRDLEDVDVLNIIHIGKLSEDVSKRLTLQTMKGKRIWVIQDITNVPIIEYFWSETPFTDLLLEGYTPSQF